MNTIDQSWVMPLAYGGAFLGSGGSGESLLLQLHLETLLRSGQTVKMLDVSEVDEEAHYASICMMGSTELSDENPMTSTECAHIISRLSALTKHECEGIFPLEAVSVNILYPVIGAAILGLPLIDGDAMARAFPELQMTTFHINNISCNPCVFQDNRGNRYEHF